MTKCCTRTGIESQNPLLNPGPRVASLFPLGWGHGHPPGSSRISLAVSILGKQTQLRGAHVDQVVQLPLAFLQLLEVLGQSFKPPTDPHCCMAASAGRQREGWQLPAPLPRRRDPQQNSLLLPLFCKTQVSPCSSWSGSSAGKQQRAEAGLQGRLAGFNVGPECL